MLSVSNRSAIYNIKCPLQLKRVHTPRSDATRRSISASLCNGVGGEPQTFSAPRGTVELIGCTVDPPTFRQRLAGTFVQRGSSTEPGQYASPERHNGGMPASANIAFNLAERSLLARVVHHRAPRTSLMSRKISRDRGRHCGRKNKALPVDNNIDDP